MEMCIECGEETARAERCHSCQRKKHYEDNKVNISDKSKKHYQENRESILIRKKEDRKSNPDKHRAYGKKWRETHREEKRLQQKARYIKKKEYVKAKSKKWYNENKERNKETSRIWRANNPHYFRDYFREGHNNIGVKLRTRVNQAFALYTNNGKIKPSNEYGINYKAIIEHLGPCPGERSLYHIDHIRPLCSFNFINEDKTQNLEEIKKAFAPENHQWLLAEENLSKGGKWGTVEQVGALFN